MTECRRCQMRGDVKKIWANNPLVLFNKLTDHLMEEHALECAFCYLKFENFGALAAHVGEAHVDAETRAKFQNSGDPWNNDMSLPAPGGGNVRSTPSGGTGRAKQTVPYLKTEDLQGDPVRAKILAINTQQTKYNDITVKIAISGKPFFLGLKASNENYEMLFNAFGDNETKWVGEEIMVGNKWNDFHEKNFVHVFEAPARKAAGGKSK